jgi:hypothetical protein
MKDTFNLNLGKHNAIHSCEGIFVFTNLLELQGNYDGNPSNGIQYSKIKAYDHVNEYSSYSTH